VPPVLQKLQGLVPALDWTANYVNGVAVVFQRQ
jgi:hypothetical protein